MALTKNQDDFCKAIASGMNQTEAYLSAYPNFKGNRKTAMENASRLRADGKVKARIDELQKAIDEPFIQDQRWDKEKATDTLLWLIEFARNEAEKRGKLTAAGVSAINASVKELNTMYGVDKPESENEGVLSSILKAVKDIG